MTKILVTEKLKEVLFNNNIDVKDYAPAYNGESAGLDLYNCGENYTITPSTYRNVTLENQYDKKKFKALIPTGIKISIPKGYVALIQERGSITKTPLKIRAGVIDCGYTDEVFVNCINTGTKEYMLESGAKLPFQIVVVKCDNQFDIVSEQEYLEITEYSKRKSGSIGSSD